MIVFELARRGTTVGREVRGGITTFMAMAYIILLNPIILAGAQDVTGAKLTIAQLTTSTALAAAISTLLMAFVGNAPFGLAAGLGLNAVVAYQAAPHMTWAQAMGLVVLEGLVIIILAVTGLRTLIMNSIPLALKHAISVGIGM
ncbi:MAG: NCS2 family permease, partial [Nonomuraea sp.]|nr:NCS2 family permease [Nonomuraea sp.]